MSDLPDLPDLPEYKCHKVVKAAQIIHVGVLDLTVVSPALVANGVGIEPSGEQLYVTSIKLSSEWINKHAPEEGGYFVIYEDGYTSYSPAEAFEAGYSRRFDFSNESVRTADAAYKAELKKAEEPPTVTPEHIESVIVGEAYFTGKEGADAGFGSTGGDPFRFSESLSLLTFCVLVLRNGFTVVGKSACVAPERFDVDLGIKYAREDAINQVWAFEGYLLKERLHQGLATSSGEAE